MPYISLCDVMDGDARRFEDLKRNVLTVQRECMLYERIKNAIELNVKLALFENVDLVFISEFGIKDLDLNLKAGSNRKLRNAEYKARLAAYKKILRLHQLKSF